MKISKKTKEWFFWNACFLLLGLPFYIDFVTKPQWWGLTMFKNPSKSLLDLPFIIRHLRHFTQRSKRNWYLECYHLVSSKRYFSSLFCTLTHHRMQTGLAERSRVWIGISGIRRELKRVSPVLPHFQFHTKDP